MGLMEKLFGKNKGQNDVWDSSIEEIPYQEAIRYKIYEHLGKVKPGDSLSEEDIFGKGCVTLDDHYEFIGALLKQRNPIPFYETLKEVKEAEKNVGDDAEEMCKICNTYLAMSAFADANKWFMKASDLGNTDAMDRLADAYKYGWGVEQDTCKAIELYKKAIVTDGNSDALLDLALCYQNGEGVPVDLERSFFLMERSAKQGNMVAQYNTGFFYCAGKGVEVNLEEALRWLRLSAAQGDEQAIACIEQYGASILSVIFRQYEQ